MLRTYKKTLTVALTALALTTASLAATSDAFAGGGGWGHHHGFGGLYVGGGGTCWVLVRGVLVNICY